MCQDVSAGRHVVTAADHRWVLLWLERHIHVEDARPKRRLDASRRESRRPPRGRGATRPSEA